MGYRTAFILMPFNITVSRKVHFNLAGPRPHDAKAKTVRQANRPRAAGRCERVNAVPRFFFFFSLLTASLSRLVFLIH